MGGLGQLLVVIGHEQPGQVVLPGGGVHQIGRQRRVEHKAPGGQLPLQQGAHHVLEIVPHLADVIGKQRRQQLVPVAGIAVCIQLRRPAAVCAVGALHRQRPQIGRAVYRHILRPAPQGQIFLRLLRRLQYLRRGGVVGQLLRLTLRRLTVLVDKLLEFQPQKQVVQLRAEGLAQVGLRHEVQRRVRDDGGQPIAVPCRRLALLQSAQHRRLHRQAVQLRIDVVNAAIGLYQRHGGLFSDTGHTGDVVAAVPCQRLQVDHVNGVEAVLRPERFLRHIPRAVIPSAGQQEHAGAVGDQLQAVPVAGGDDAVPAIGLAFAADGAEQVVGLVARQLIAGNGHGGQHLLERQHLLRQLVGHALAGGLVRGVGLVPERRLPPVKGHADRVGLFVVQQLLQHGDKAVHGVGVQPLPRCQELILAHAVEGAVHKAVAIEHHEFHAGISLSISYLLYYTPFFSITQPPIYPCQAAVSFGIIKPHSTRRSCHARSKKHLPRGGGTGHARDVRQEQMSGKGAAPY